jgi:hypothetical protein
LAGAEEGKNRARGEAEPWRCLRFRLRNGGV